MLQFQCRKCGFQGPTLEGHKCAVVSPAADRLAAARAVLSEASERVGASVAREAFREAAVAGQTFVRDGRVLKGGEVLAPAKAGFDRAAYQREYMRGWRARKKAEPAS